LKFEISKPNRNSKTAKKYGTQELRKNFQTAIRNPKSAIRSPQSAIRNPLINMELRNSGRDFNPQSAIRNSQSAIRNPMSEVRGYRTEFCYNMDNSSFAPCAPLR